MAVINLSADSTTVVLNGTNFQDFIDGDIITITFPNQNTSHTRSLQSVNIQQRSDKDVAQIVLRVAKYSDGDETLNSWANMTPTTVISGSIKENYEKDGEARISTYRLDGATIMQKPEDVRNNQDGSNVLEYTIQANRCIRSL